jgi:hypothetical protein
MWSIHRNRPADADESVEAVKDAVRHLAAVDKNDAEVKKLASSFRKMRTENHFSDKIHTIMGGG